MSDSRITEDIWEDIGRDFLKQTALAVLDFVTFREALTEDQIQDLARATVRSIALTGASHTADRAVIGGNSAERHTLEAALAWATLDGFLVAAALEHNFRVDRVRAHCAILDEWIGQRGSDEALKREFELHNFSRDEGLQILYSKRPVARAILEELFVHRGPIGYDVISVSQESEAVVDIEQPLFLNSLIGAALFEFDIGIATEDDSQTSWVKRANQIFQVKPSIFGFGVNFNAIVDQVIKGRSVDKNRRE